MAILFYKEFGELGYLANYADYGFTKDGIFYKTVEHYYQSQKFDNPKIKMKIIEAGTPKEASNIGRDRNNTRIENFKEIKNQVMYDGVLEKFRQNRDIAYKLIETRNENICEATIDEYYWGIGKDNTGQNHMGNILVNVRKQIKSEILNSILEKAKKLGKVYVIGHRKLDADSAFSMYLLTNILNKLGIKAEMGCLNTGYELASEDKMMIESFLPVRPKIVPRDSYFIMVDRNNLDDLDSEHVIGAIDHHVISHEVYDTLEIEYAATALLIYDLFKNVYNFSTEEKKLIYLAVLADTFYLCSSRFSDEDKKIIAELKIDMDVKDIQRTYFKTNDFALGVEENLLSNYKEYDKGNIKIKRSLIYSYHDDFLEYYNQYVDYVSHLEDNWLLIWCDFEENKTHIFYNGVSNKYDRIITSTNVILKKIL